MALKTDIPTQADLERLLAAHGRACVSIYLPTYPVTQEAERARIELKNLSSEAIGQLRAADRDKRTIATIAELLESLDEDEAFWAKQSHSLAVFASADGLTTFRIPNRLSSAVEVADRFYVKPLLRAVTFPQTAFILALSQNSVRLLEATADAPAVEVAVPDLPTDAASSVGRASIRGTAPKGRLQGHEGQKVRLRQYARRIDEALRPVLSGGHRPMILAATEPLSSIFAGVCSYPHLAGSVIDGSPDDSSDAELADASRPILDQLYSDELVSLKGLYEQRVMQGKATDALSTIARAATAGAVETALVDIDETIPGTIDPESGEVSVVESDDASHYGVVDEIVRRVLLARGRVLAVRRDDVPGSGPVAALLRYPV